MLVNSKDRTAGVYAIRNSLDGKVYVGSASNLYGRWRSHKCALRNQYHKNPYLQSAWNKHGESAFSCSVLEYCEKFIMFDVEQRHMDALKAHSREHGYNIAKLAAGAFGIPQSAATRKKRSMAMKGHKVKFTPEWLEKLRIASTGHKHSDEHKKNIHLASLKRMSVLPFEILLIREMLSTGKSIRGTAIELGVPRHAVEKIKHNRGTYQYF